MEILSSDNALISLAPEDLENALADVERLTLVSVEAEGINLVEDIIEKITSQINLTELTGIKSIICIFECSEDLGLFVVVHDIMSAIPDIEGPILFGSSLDISKNQYLKFSLVIWR